MNDDEDPDFPMTRTPSVPPNSKRPTYRVDIDAAGNWIIRDVVMWVPLPKPAPAAPKPVQRQESVPPPEAPDYAVDSPVPVLGRLAPRGPLTPVPSPGGSGSVSSRSRESLGRDPVGAAKVSHPALSSVGHSAESILSDAGAEPYRRIGVALLGLPPEPQPARWPYPISKADAEAKFVAACRAAHDQATGSASPAQQRQQPETPNAGVASREPEMTETCPGPVVATPISNDVATSNAPSDFAPAVSPVDLARGATGEPSGLFDSLPPAAWSGGVGHSEVAPRPSNPSPLLELAASTMNPRYAAQMLGYDWNTFGDMIHSFKDFYLLKPNDNVLFDDDGDVFHQGLYVGNINEFAR